MNTWLQLLPKLKPGARVVVQHVQGAKFEDTIADDLSSFGPSYFNCRGGTYSLRNGWHVLGERRVVDVVEEKVKAPHIATPREKLIGALSKKHPPVHD